MSTIKQQIEFLENKIKSLDIEQNALKILANSGYGAMGNQHFRYFKLENAEAITTTGQFVIRYIDREVNKFLQEIFKSKRDRVIISDTDSVVVELSDLFYQNSPPIEERIEILNKFAETVIQPKIGKIIKNIVFLFNAFPNLLAMKREILADKTIVIAKKKYIMNVYDKEGVRFTSPKKKIMGLEAIKSSTPAICKQLIRDTLDVFFTSDNSTLLHYVENCKQKIILEATIDDIAFPRGLQVFDVYQQAKKAIPIHVKAAITFNNYISKQQLTKKYELLKEGDKIKFCYLKLPNPFHSHVIAWNTNVVPKELELDRFIDKEHQYYIGYLNPIESIIEAIGWTTKVRGEVSDLF